MLLLSSLLVVARHSVELLTDYLVDLHTFLDLVELLFNVI